MTNPSSQALIDERKRAVRYAIGLIQDRIQVEASANTAILQDYAATLRDLLSVIEQPRLIPIPEDWAEAASLAQALCESEARRMSHVPSTADHWQSVATRLKALYIAADHVGHLVRDDGQQPQPREKRIADLTNRLKRVCRAANDRLVESTRTTIRQALREVELRRREAALLTPRVRDEGSQEAP